MKYDASLTLILITLILVITFIPLLIGCLIAKAFNVTGLPYYTTVLSVACIIWMVLLIYYYK